MSKQITTDQEALDYHEFPKSGKISVEITKSVKTQKDLSLAYTPGVAVPCLAIQKNPDDANRYTSKNNLVAVISNGTAVLGLGNIGALASKPVMEGKGVLFKSFSGLDSFDIEIDSEDVDRFCDTVEAISPTFGGINLEDIKAPECFEIERRLVKKLDIPVMHDDQHGTAVISTAAIINASKITNRKIKDLKIVMVGAGAAAISCARFYKYIGIENICMIDSKGVIHDGRNDLNDFKKEFSIQEEKTQSEVFDGADVVVGLSRPGSFCIDDIKKMADNPIVFTLANPTPEIFPKDIIKARKDAIIATGRSDFDNQVNNVLGFPFIFRGAMDVKAKQINMQMKIAATYALAELATKEVPESICELYGKKIKFGKEYIIPKPFDKRLVVEISSAVARAAIKSGASSLRDFDIKDYKLKLADILK